MRHLLVGLRSLPRRLWRWLWPPSIPLTPLGWSTVVVGVAAWLIGASLGWEEFLVLAASCLLAVVVGLAWVLRAPVGETSLTVDPERVAVGGNAQGHLVVANPFSRRVPATSAAVPVGARVAVLSVPALAMNTSWENTFVVPTDRRAVIELGPPWLIRADPLGMARRKIVGDDTATLHVHPHTTRLPPLSTGLLRDLDGVTTNDLSSSDVAFHTLREYVPGDALRQVHWRTTARLGTLMVRQFVDTRQTRLGLVMSATASDWASEEEFEFGISVYASLGRAALSDQHPVTAMVGDRALAATGSTRFMDELAAVEFDGSELRIHNVASKAALLLRGSSLIVLVSGSPVAPAQLRRAAERFVGGARLIAVRCDPDSPSRMRVFDRVSVLTVPSLESFGQAVARGALT